MIQNSWLKMNPEFFLLKQVRKKIKYFKPSLYYARNASRNVKKQYKKVDITKCLIPED